MSASGGRAAQGEASREGSERSRPMFKAEGVGVGTCPPGRRRPNPETLSGRW